MTFNFLPLWTHSSGNVLSKSFSPLPHFQRHTGETCLCASLDCLTKTPFHPQLKEFLLIKLINYRKMFLAHWALKLKIWTAKFQPLKSRNLAWLDTDSEYLLQWKLYHLEYAATTWKTLVWDPLHIYNLICRALHFLFFHLHLACWEF